MFIWCGGKKHSPLHPHDKLRSSGVVKFFCMYYLHKDFLITSLSDFCSPKLHDGIFINDTTQWFCN